MNPRKDRPTGEPAGGQQSTGSGSSAESSISRRPVPDVKAVCYAPSGRRLRYLAVVLRCPHCKGCHLHYGECLADLMDTLKSGSCGRAYRLHAVRLVEGGVADV